MSRLKLVLVTVAFCLGTGNAFGQLAAVKPVSSSPLRMQTLGNSLTVNIGKFQSIQSLRDQPVQLKGAQQHDLESEVKALQEQEKVAPAAPDLNQDTQTLDDSLLPGSIRDVQINILFTDKRVPDDRSTELFASSPQGWHDFSAIALFVNWDSPQICYGRLYFEDPILERYGQSTTPHHDVIRSETHFVVSTVMWPLRAILDIPGKCETPYGYCRPGTALPEMRQHWITR